MELTSKSQTLFEAKVVDFSVASCKSVSSFEFRFHFWKENLTHLTAVCAYFAPIALIWYTAEER